MVAALEAVLANIVGKELEATVRAILAVAIDHQFARSQLASALEYVEQFLPMEHETQRFNQLVAHRIAGLLGEFGIADTDLAARDVAALSRGLIDAAGLAGETDKEAVADRLAPAILGYLAAQGSRPDDSQRF